MLASIALSLLSAAIGLAGGIILACRYETPRRVYEAFFRQG